MKFTNKKMRIGNIAETRRGDRFLIFDEYLSNMKGFLPAFDFSDCLVNLKNHDNDIVRIYKPARYSQLKTMLEKPGELIWQSSDIELDVSKLKVDTPLIVFQKDPITGLEIKFIRYFAFANIEKREIYCWNGGCTSLTAKDKEDYTVWYKAELYTPKNI